MESLSDKINKVATKYNLNILMVSTRKHVKGPIPFITDLLVFGLETLGCKVTLLSCWGLKKENESVFRKVIDRIKDVILIAKEAKSKAYDLIYIHSAHSTIIRDLVLLLVLKFYKIPTILLLHGSWPQKMSYRRHPFFTITTRMTFKLVSGLFLLSNEEKKAFEKIWPWVNCGVVPNPVKCHQGDIANKTVFRSNQRCYTLLFAGRLIPEKGIIELVEALPKVLSKINCRLVIAGDGPLLPEIQDKLIQYKIEKNVSLTGFVNHNFMWNFYQQADVLILPTHGDGEGMPMVILEAIANGVGIICTPIRGLVDYLQEGVNALFVPLKDPERLAERIIELLSDYQLLSKMHKANIELSKEFEPVKVVQRHLEVMARLIPELKEKIESLPVWER